MDTEMKTFKKELMSSLTMEKKISTPSANISSNNSDCGKANESKLSDMSSEVSETKLPHFSEVNNKFCKKVSKSRELKNRKPNIGENSGSEEFRFKRLLRSSDISRCTRKAPRSTKTLREHALRSVTKTETTTEISDVETNGPKCIVSMLKELCDTQAKSSARSSSRLSEAASRSKAIVTKKYNKFCQFIIVPNMATKNCLSIAAIKELRDALSIARKDNDCRAVLINSSGSHFCNGIDLAEIAGTKKKRTCEEMATVIKDLVTDLGQFPKPVVAAVNGNAMGFGVSLLTYCDIVISSDKATFCIPANTIGYIPEGGVTMTLPQVVGKEWACEMLLRGIKITAQQAFQKGLVSEVVWPTLLMNTVMPRMEALASQPLQVLVATKLMVRSHFFDQIKNHLESERRLLASSLSSAECQANICKIISRGCDIMD